MLLRSGKLINTNCFLKYSFVYIHFSTDNVYWHNNNNSIQYTFSFIKTPMFVGNSLYDTAQLAGLGLGCLPPHCPEDKMKFFYNFRTVSDAKKY